MTIKTLYPTVRPTLNLDFAKTKALDPRITFTRASTGTFMGSNGLIKTAASGAARFDHNQTTEESLGLLIEGESTNMFTYSEQFDNAQWVLGGNITGTTNVSANQTTAPDGTSAADLITISSTTSRFGAGVAFRTGCAPNTTYTASFFVKAKELTRVAIVGWDSGYGFRSSGGFNMATQSWYGTSYGVFNRSYQAFPNGWYRLNFTFVTSSAGANAISILISNPDGTATDGMFDSGFLYNGTPYSGQGLYIWGAQLETSSFPTSYIPTVASTVTRAADVASITGTNFSSWYNQSEGTILWSSRKYVNGGAGAEAKDYFVLDNFQLNDEGTTIQASKAGVGYYYIGPTVNLNTSFKVAIALKNGSYAGSTNGQVASASALQAIDPASTSLNLTPTRVISGTIARLTYYPVRLPDAQLQALTAT